jgi:hypothetical protein
VAEESEPEVEDAAGRQSAGGGDGESLPGAEGGGDFHQVATLAKEEGLEQLGGAVEGEIDDAAEDPDAAGEQEVDGWFTEAETSAQAEQGLPVAVGERAEEADQLAGFGRPVVHGGSIAPAGGF